MYGQPLRQNSCNSIYVYGSLSMPTTSHWHIYCRLFQDFFFQLSCILSFFRVQWKRWSATHKCCESPLPNSYMFLIISDDWKNKVWRVPMSLKHRRCLNRLWCVWNDKWWNLPITIAAWGPGSGLHYIWSDDFELFFLWVMVSHVKPSNYEGRGGGDEVLWKTTIWV